MISNLSCTAICPGDCHMAGEWQRVHSALNDGCTCHMHMHLHTLIMMA